MSNFKSYREESRRNYGTSNGEFTLENIQLGALLRIADASEAMAKNHTQLLSDLEFYKRRFKEEQQAAQRLARRNATLRGLVTKMKKKAAQQ